MQKYKRGESMEERENTVVLFPNLSHRLKEKGFDALNNKKFQEALDCFEQLLNYGLEDEHSEFGAVVCLMELGEWKEAKVRCQALMEGNEAFDADVLEMYISILVQLNDYKAIAKITDLTLRQHKLPEEQEQKLISLSSFAKKMEQEADAGLPDEEEFAEVFRGNDITKQLQALQLLKCRGTVEAFSFLQSFLEDETKHPYIKTSVIHMFMEYNISEAVTVTKYGRTVQVVPSELSPVRELPFVQAVLTELEDRVGQDNPTLFEAISTYWYEIQELVFPVQVVPERAQLWAAALEKLGTDRFFAEADDEVIANGYGVTSSELAAAYEYLLLVEKEGFFTV
jgi:tetratricopeptide (TPR) repeat protein